MPFTGEPENFPAGTVNPPVPLMRSQTQFHTAVAVQRPRNLDKVVVAVLQEAEFAGDAFFYSFPMGGKKIEAPSISLARAVATDKALKFLAGYAITEERVIAVLNKPKHEWASEDIAALRGMASQLKDGQATAEHLFTATAAKEERPKAATPKEENKGKRGRGPKEEAPVTHFPPASLLPRAATPEDLEAIRQTCLEKEIDLELILQKWQVSRLEELDGASIQQVQEWLKGQ